MHADARRGESEHGSEPLYRLVNREMLTAKQVRSPARLRAPPPRSTVRAPDPMADPLAPSPAPAKPWRWIPTLYFTQGLPNVAVATIALVMYKNLGVSNAEIAFFTSWLYLPWVIKPLWSPWVERWGRKRTWTIALQFVLGAALAGVALAVPAPFFLQATLAVFWLVAFSSATHDIAADGFYLLALPKPQQAAFVGVRSTFFRVAMITGQGGLVFLAGKLMPAGAADPTATSYDPAAVAHAWAIVFGLLAGWMLVAALWHQRVLPRPETDRAGADQGSTWQAWWTVFAAFFRQPGIGRMLAFLLCYRFAEAQLLRLVIPFLLDGRDQGGLALTNESVGVIYGTLGVIALLVGGILGGWLVSQHGLRRLRWWLVAAINVPNAVFVGLALTQPDRLAVVAAALVVEQFGYGLGFTGYMIAMMMMAEGRHQTAHYSICTGFMAMGVMVPGMWAGWVEEQLGYTLFFGWVLVCTLPSFFTTGWLRIESDFGRKA